MKKELLALSIGMLLLAISFSGCLEESVTAEEIKERIIQAVSGVTSYKCDVNGTMTRYTNNETGTLSPDSPSYVNYTLPYNLVCEVDISNKQLKAEMNQTHYELDYKLNQTFYFENDTLYNSYDFEPWRWSTHTAVNDWYMLSHLDRLVDFILEESMVERIEDDVIDGIECYVLKVTPLNENLMLNQSWEDLLFPPRSSNLSYEKFEDDYIVNILFWVEKSTYLLKKTLIEAIYNVTISYDLLGDLMTLISNRHYETEILFYDYNLPISIEKPWQSHIDEAEASLGHLQYYNLDFGYGFNLPYGWTIQREPHGYHYGVTVYRDIFYLENNSDSNLSFWMVAGPLYENFSSFIDDRIEDFNYTHDPENFSLYHNSSTINGMNAYKFVYTAIGSNMIVKEIWVEKDEIHLGVFIEGKVDLYNLHLSDIEQSLNSSLTIVSPYFWFD